MTTIKVNGQEYRLDASPDTPLLWVLRDTLGLTGTKYSCGKGLCGACAVHLDGELIRSCSTPLADVSGGEITTIEGLAPDSPVHQAWTAENVTQCGYCQPGQVMAATALLAQNPTPSDAEIDIFMSGHLCRCGTYPRIRRAIHRAAGQGG